MMFALLLASPVDSSAQTEASKEYQVKAAFIFNFAQFVDWPPAVFTNASAPLCIGILGDDPFGKILDATVNGEKVDGHPIVIRRFQRAEEALDCQVLFVSRSETRRMRQILASLKDRSILTIGEVDGFCKDGGIIRFVTEQNKIRFRINPETAKNANLTVSSKLLRLAQIVQPGGD
ncbi:MAG: YfiR family protein [Verrucomicrobia bacterium]|nr:YfiR family protein [Verrucomicrobiota bacterium]